ncbi:MAG: DUF2125 domain-containing protein [Kiloniellales bacterium]|nr:DUF2125 domain-containing protein [Kiloniellales bacterium]
MPRSAKLALLFLLLLPLLGVPAAWVLSGAVLRHSFEAWVQDRREDGYALRYAEPELAGFPFGLDVRIDDPSVESPEGWQWRGPALTGGATLWDPLTLALQAPGRHLVDWGPREGRLSLRLDAAKASGTAALALDGRLRRADAALHEILAEGPLPGPVQIERLDLVYRDRDEEDPTGEVREGGPRPPGDLLMTVLGVDLPPGLALPLGPRVELFLVEGRLEGPLPAEASRRSLALWRDAGGLLDIHRLELRWGPLQLEAEGQLALDRELRPTGQLTSNLRGGADLVDHLAERKMIAERAAGALKLAFFALSRSAEDGGPPVVELPVNLKDGLLYLGPVALFRLRPVL